MLRSALFLLTLTTSVSAAPFGEWTWTRLDDAGLRAARTVDRASGATYLLTNEYRDRRYTGSYALQRLRADGTLDWRRVHAGAWAHHWSFLDAAAGRVCVVGGGDEVEAWEQPLHVACYRESDGEFLWRTKLLDVTNLAIDTALIAVQPDRTVVVASNEALTTEEFAETTRVHHWRMSADGAVASHTVHVSHMRAGMRLGEDGQALFEAGGHSEPRRYTVLDAHGGVRREITAAELGFSTAYADIAPDGSVYVIGNKPNSYDRGKVEIKRFGASGPGALVRDLGTAQVSNGRFLFEGADVYLSATLLLTNEFAGYLFALTAPTWSRPMDQFLVFDPATRAPFTVSQDRRYVVLRAIDRATGGIAWTRRLALGPAYNYIDDVHATANGGLRSLNATDNGRDYVFSLADAFARPAATRLDQVGARGAWYATYSGGQGFVLEYFPGSRTLFMPWFTYARDYVHTPHAGLRWYTLQGDVSAGATRATLAILENAGGTFASGPATTPRRVGSAALELHDCANGVLDYAFDGSDAPRGSITLTRLTPATTDCELADGALQRVSSTPRDGFDARQSGAWHVPAQPGQGLMFTVQPGALLFGAWFTYDPANGVDDATKQHWLSLQGDLSASTQGVASVTLYRNAHGELDRSADAAERAGTAVVRFTACDRATLDYAFDDSDAAGSFRRRSGTLALEKIGGCTD